MSFYIQGIVFDELTGDPGSPEEGQLWYNTTEKRYKIYRDGGTQQLNDKAELDAHIVNIANPHAVSLEAARQAGDTISGSINMDGNKITNLGTATEDGDVASWGDVKQHVTNNINGLDWQESVITQVEEDPTSISPSEGDRYIVPSSGTGDWSSHVGEIAEWDGSQWTYILPNEGYTTHVEDEGSNYTFPSSGTGWVDMGSVLSHGSLQNLSADDHSQYHTDARASSWLATKDTDDLSEGSGNLYYTEPRVSANVDVAANTAHRDDLINPHQVGLEQARQQYSTLSGTIDMDGNKILGVGAPTVGTDVTNKDYADENIGGITISGSGPTDGQHLEYVAGTGNWTYTDAGGSGPGASAKAGVELKAAFSGNPKKATVTFASSYPDTNYSISLSAVTTSNSNFAPIVENQTVSGFDINMGANNINKLTSVLWMTMPHGE